ncbi:glutamine amidotransferase [candidate division KSB1 bacterium]
MAGKIAYFGDGDLNGAAAYLGGILTHGGFDFTHIPSDSVLPGEIDLEKISLFILSDYPARHLGNEGLRGISDRVKTGAGLLMIGGWESYHGSGGDYQGTDIAEILPIIISPYDDRVNSHEPCLVEAMAPKHPALDGLPWDKVPAVAGFNMMLAREIASVLLCLHRLDITLSEGQFSYNFIAEHPLLTVGTAGKGRTAAFASDVAPHWIGGMVDWGPERLNLHVEVGGEVEIGNWYAKFFQQLVRWCMGS